MLVNIDPNARSSTDGTAGVKKIQFNRVQESMFEHECLKKIILRASPD